MTQKKKPKWKKIIKKFDTISLKKLNEKAKLLDRKEVKYVVHQKALTGLFNELMQYFDVLEIDGKRVFTYESIYMDTDEREFYHKHNGGHRNRIKIRTRRYVDADLHFFEFKHRDHDMIRKYRYAIDQDQHGSMDQIATEFVEDTHQAIYGEPFGCLLRPTMITTYRRVTLVHKTSEERLTIDLDLSFGLPSDKKKDHHMPPIAIIEAKTKESHTPTHDIFARHNIMEKNACSKYCLAHYYLDEVSNRDHFQSTIEHIAELAQINIQDMFEIGPDNIFVRDAASYCMTNSSLTTEKV